MDETELSFSRVPSSVAAKGGSDPLLQVPLPDVTADENIPPKSQTLKELARISPEIAAKTIKRLTDGFTDSSGRGYPPAKRNNAGCIVTDPQGPSPTLDS